MTTKCNAGIVVPTARQKSAVTEDDAEADTEDRRHQGATTFAR